MKVRPRYSDFELDYDKFPVRQLGGIADMNAIKRMDYRDALFERANNEWMDEAEKQIKELKNKLRVYKKTPEIIRQSEVYGKIDWEAVYKSEQALVRI